MLGLNSDNFSVGNIPLSSVSLGLTSRDFEHTSISYSECMHFFFYPNLLYYELVSSKTKSLWLLDFTVFFKVPLYFIYMTSQSYAPWFISSPNFVFVLFLLSI